MSELTLAFDVGRTSCRAALVSAQGVVAGSTSPAPPAPIDGIEADLVADRLAATAAELIDHTGQGALDHTSAVAAGLPGLLGRNARSTELAVLLAERFPGKPVFVTGDVVAAHAGALGGRPGVVLIAGTGAVAFGLDAKGGWRFADGAGPLLGDRGGGYDVGRAGLWSVRRALEGRGTETTLVAAAEQRYGDLDDLAVRVHSVSSPVPFVAAFAEDVIAAANAGDAEAIAICESAAEALADTTVAAAAGIAGALNIRWVGGLVGEPSPLVSRLRAVLSDRLPHADLGPAAESPAHGLRLLTADPGLPHHALVTTAGPHREAAPLPATERVDPRLHDLDQRSTVDIVQTICARDMQVPVAVTATTEAIADAADLVVERLRAGGRMIYVGSGTSGRLAVLDAAELPPTFGIDPEWVQAVVSGGSDAVSLSVEGAEDDTLAAARDLAGLELGPRDVVVAVAASGRTPYSLAALETARSAGAATVAVVNNVATPVAAAAEIAIEVLTGAEVIAGSTRMKAGSAQKMVLNALSTTVMVKLGKTYGNLMVDVRTVNAKLRERARRIIEELTGADTESAERALEAADGEVKPALVSLMAGVDVAEARRLLEQHGGSVRAAANVGPGDKT